MFSLGRPCVSNERFLSAIIDAFLEAIRSEGTLIMPTFTYSFCRNEIYGVQQSSSTVGILTEYYKKRNGVVRTRPPIFSFALKGAREKELLNIGEDAFADDSLYGLLREMGGKLVYLGAPRGYAFYYLAEEKVGVSHRFFKKFSGMIKDGEVMWQSTVPYYVRFLDKRSEEDEKKVNDFLNQKGIQNQIRLRKGSISCVKCQDMFEACVDQIMIDETYFLKD